MASDLLNILDPHSDEFKESFIIFQQYYPRISAKFFLKSVFLPLKRLGPSPASPGKFTTILDCVNAEKHKRMKSLLSSTSTPLIYVSDLSTDRSKLFCSNLDSSVPKFFEKVRYQNYWGSLFQLFGKTLSRSAGIRHFFSLFTFQARALQDLIQYDWLLRKTEAKTLMTANEDSWIAPLLALYCRSHGVQSMNVMHGRVYQAKQFYDQSIVYGRSSQNETKKIAAPHTQVILKPLAEITENKIADHFEQRKKIILFDQPVFEFYSIEMQRNLYSCLERLVKQGFSVSVKPHPAQTNLEELKQRPFQIMVNGVNRELLQQHGIGMGICSTVAMEVISSGVPMIYFNHERLLDRFIQIKFLSDSSPKTTSEIEALVSSLQNRDFYDHFQKNQLALLNAEYAV